MYMLIVCVSLSKVILVVKYIIYFSAGMGTVFFFLHESVSKFQAVRWAGKISKTQAG